MCRAELKGPEMLNGKLRRRTWIRPCLFAATISLILTGKLSASVIRIDGAFQDWKDVKVCAYDPRGDAKGAFDITKVYAASQGSILYLRFDTASLLNLQNGPETEETLLVIIDLPNNQELVLDTRGRQAFLNDSLKERIPWDRLKYIVGPTYAQDEFEIQIDLGRFNINRGDAIRIQFDGSDQLSAPVTFTFSQPSETRKRRSHRRNHGTDVRIVSFNTYFEGLSDPNREEADVRIVSFNTYFEGLSDPNREEAMARLLNSVDGDVYCFQEEWKTEGHGEILKRLMPLESKGRWHIHKVHGNVIASKYPLKALPSKNDRYAAAYIGLAENNLFIINVHLKAMGYIDSEEDRLRIRQVNDIIAMIDEIHNGQYDKVKEWLTPNLIGESVITWRGGSRASFSPGKLDYVIYSAKTLIPGNGFILNSELLNRTERRQLSLDAADSKLSDHLLVTVDFQFSDSPED